MPEEINRRLTDHVSTYLFTTSPDAGENLAAEGIAAERVHFVGNMMIDTLLRFREAARDRRAAARFGLEGRDYAVLTLHRPDNVDERRASSRRVLDARLDDRPARARRLPRAPADAQAAVRHGARRALDGDEACVLVDPLGYLDFVGLLDGARLVLTDSGGIQEETTVLGVPCLTLRPSTERPVTVDVRDEHASSAPIRERIVAAALADARRRPRRAAACPSSGTAGRASGSPRCSHATSGGAGEP